MQKTKINWHREGILFSLKKKGTTLSALSREKGLARTTLSNAIARPWTKGEWLIANKIGLFPWKIWPSRYFDAEGKLIKEKIKSVLNMNL